MKVSKFELGAPDSTGDMALDAVVLVDNPTKEEVRWVQYQFGFFDKDGFPLSGSNDDDDDCTLEVDGELPISPGWGSLRSRTPDKARRSFTVDVTAILHAREFYKLGEVDVPAADRGTSTLKKTIRSTTIDGAVKVLVTRGMPDEERRSELDCRLAVRNISGLHLGRVELRGDFVDPDGASNEAFRARVAIPAHSLGYMQVSLGYFRKSQLRGARLSLTLSMFRPVHTSHCSGRSTPSKG